MVACTQARRGREEVGNERKGRQMRRKGIFFGENYFFRQSEGGGDGEEGGRRRRTPFEPWAQKLAHWSPGYCINAVGGRDGGEIIFAQKCNEASRSTGPRGARAVNNMNAKNHLLKVSQYDDGLKMDARSGRRKRRPQHNLALPDDLELRAVVVFVIGHGSWSSLGRSVSELLIRGAQIRLRPSFLRLLAITNSCRKA